MLVVIKDDIATPIRRDKGSTVTLFNQSAVDVYWDTTPDRLNASLTGAVPNGTKLANTNGAIQLPDFPGVIWARAVQKTTLEVQP